MIRRLILIASMFVAGPAAAIDLPWSDSDDDPAAPPLPRPVVSVVVEDVPSERRSFPGVVISGTEVQLGFQTLGRLSSRPVEVGDEVSAGDVLATLRPDDLQDNVRAARAAVDNAEVTLETARAAADRTRDLARNNVASTAQLEQAERGLKAAEAGLEQAKSDLARAQDAEGFAKLAAPFDGVVSAVFENPGTVVAAGTPVLTLSEVDTREAIIDLPEAILATLSVGMPVSIWLEADPDTRTSGFIHRIDPLADAATRTRRVHLTMEDLSEFRLNSLVRAQYGGGEGSVVTLPASALTGDDDDPAVWIVKRSGASATVTMRRVSVGLKLGGFAVIDSGIEVGEEVVIRGVNSLSEGQEVGRQVDP